MASAHKTLESYADEARTLLAQLPDIPARAALQSLADFVVARTG
jgi:heptaprenyl diphosphate synthase